MSDPIAPVIQGFIAAHGWIDDLIDEVAISNTDAEVLANKIRQQIGRELLERTSNYADSEYFVFTDDIREVCKLENNDD